MRPSPFTSPLMPATAIALAHNTINIVIKYFVFIMLMAYANKVSTFFLIS